LISESEPIVPHKKDDQELLATLWRNCRVRQSLCWSHCSHCTRDLCSQKDL